MKKYCVFFDTPNRGNVYIASNLPRVIAEELTRHYDHLGVENVKFIKQTKKLVKEMKRREGNI